MKKFELYFGLLKIPIDFASTIIAFLAAYQLRLNTDPIKGIAKPIDYTSLPSNPEYLKLSIIAAILLLATFSFGKMYSFKSTTQFSREAKQTFILCLVWAMIIITCFFFTRTFPFSHLAIIYGWILTFTFVLTGRALIKLLQHSLLKTGFGKRRLAFIGNNNLGKDLQKQLQTDVSYELLGQIGTSSKNIDDKTLGPIENLEKIIKKYKIDEIIQVTTNLPHQQNEDIIEICDLLNVHYRFVPDLLEVRRTNLEINTIGFIPVISLKTTPLDGWGKIIKRIIDICGSIVGILILSPILLIIAIAIKVNSKGPILFYKDDNGKIIKRIGQNGKPFICYKFRSMQHKTDNLRKTILAKDNIKNGPLTKIKNDPRITTVGKFIRKHSLDELPQLLNVLFGHLSLVGPRPHLPEEVANYKKHHRFILTMKPGLTGLTQVSGKDQKLNFENEVKIERYYIENWSLFLDIKIIFKTIAVVFKGQNE